LFTRYLRGLWRSLVFHRLEPQIKLNFKQGCDTLMYFYFVRIWMSNVFQFDFLKVFLAVSKISVFPLFSRFNEEKNFWCPTKNSFLGFLGAICYVVFLRVVGTERTMNELSEDLWCLADTSSILLTPFFRWVQTSVRLCASRSQKNLGKIGLILKQRDVQIGSLFFFRKLLKNFFYIPQLQNKPYFA